MVRTTLVAAVVVGVCAPLARGSIVVQTVSAKHSVQFAGLTAPAAIPFGRTAADFHGDLTASDVFPEFVDLSCFAGALLFEAAGQWQSGPDGALASGPAGDGTPAITEVAYADFGVSGLTAPLNALVGVFSTDLGPSPSATPVWLGVGSDMTRPLLNQSFAIGAGLGAVAMPTGATRLYLGMHDAGAWSDNVGDVRVRITQSALESPATAPEPPSTLVYLGALAIWAIRRRRTSARGDLAA